ncbi:MAG: T9SS type A sorting domain-containing protein [Bacteroidetes bacterium]|nr:T9SS type A sorting domain-containing protein [Bacteroidota bacterium]
MKRLTIVFISAVLILNGMMPARVHALVGITHYNYYLASAASAAIPVKGPLSLCLHQTGVHYSIDSIPGAVSYTWSVPVGATIISGQGTTAITVNFGNALGDVCVSYYDGSVNSLPSCVTTHLATTVPSMPASITGPKNSVCPGQVITYSCPLNTNASSYTWTIPNCTILSGQGTNTVQVLIGQNFTWAYVRVSASNCLGSSAQRVISVYSAPGQPGWIAGPQIGACGGSTYTYSITAVHGATSYTWFAPAGAVITSPVTNGNPLTTSVTSVDITMPAGFSEGAIYVCANSGCNSSDKRKLNVRAVPGYPYWIHGQNYGLCDKTSVLFWEDSVPGATSYTWTIFPADFTTINGNGNDSITIDFAPGFNYARLYITANNACGSSQQRVLALFAAPRKPLGIDGPIGACNSNPATSIAYYEVDTLFGTNVYHWEVPTGATIVNGQGTTHLTVDFLGSTTGNVKVRAENDCGASDYDTMYVIVNSCRFGRNDGSTAGILPDVFPNPAHDRMTISFSSSTIEKYTINLFDITGRLVATRSDESINGMNREEFELSGFAKGIYTLSLSKGETVDRIKVVIE